MSEKYNIEELIVRFLQQDINEDELRYLKSWLEEDVEHKSYFFELKGILLGINYGHVIYGFHG